MCFQTAFLGELFLTLLALKVSHTRVGHHMHVQITFLSKLFLTLRTLKVSDSSMGEDVSGNSSLTGAHLPTVVTRVGPHAWVCQVLLVPAACAGARPHIVHGNTVPGSTPVVQECSRFLWWVPLCLLASPPAISGGCHNTEDCGASLTSSFLLHKKLATFKLLNNCNILTQNVVSTERVAKF